MEAGYLAGYCLTLSGRPDEYVEVGKLSRYLDKLKGRGLAPIRGNTVLQDPGEPLQPSVAFVARASARLDDGSASRDRTMALVPGLVADRYAPRFWRGVTCS